MGTSNWQNIPYCIDVLMKIAPERALDVGVGFGRWGIILREFCDVWYGRIHKPDWKIRVEGIEGFEKKISDYHAGFYDRIHVGDANRLVHDLPGPWSVVIFGDVLEHFTKHDARRLLNTCLARSDYVLVNIPLGEDWEQGDAYGNEYERHRSSWEPEEFDSFHCVRRALFLDYIGRPFGTFCLSQRDPRGLRESLFSPVAAHPDGLTPEMLAIDDRVVRRVQEMAAELEYLRAHSTYRLGARLRRNGWWNTLRWLRHRNDRVVTLRPLGAEPGAVRLLAAHPNPGQAAVPWDFIEAGAGWTLHPDADRPYARRLDAGHGVARIPVDHDPELQFLAHPSGGRVEVSFRARRDTIDLRTSAGESLITVRPARSPMIDTAVPAVQVQFGGRPPAPAPEPIHAPGLNGHAPPSRPAPPAFTPEQSALIDNLRARRSGVLAVHTPHWTGVSRSTAALFPDRYPIPATTAEDPYAISDEALDRHAAILAAAGAPRIVISGGDRSHLGLMERLASLPSPPRIDLLWHGNFVQMGDPYTWGLMKDWLEAARRGKVHTIAVVKKGMDEFLRAAGIRSTLLLNFLDAPVKPPPAIDGDEHQVGIWLSGSYWKTAHPMLAAVALMPGARVHGAGLGAHAREMIETFRIPAGTVHEHPIDREQMLEAVRRTHLSLYVTFCECCPMFPLESLNEGVPCLIGPASHLFEDHPALAEALIVPYPDRADVIARCAEEAIRRREQIAAMYAQYIPGYTARARATLAEYMRPDADAPSAPTPIVLPRASPVTAGA